MLVTRTQLSSYAPGPSPLPGYSYPERLEATPGANLDEVREAGFERLESVGKKKAYAGIGSAMTRGAAMGIGIVAAVNLLASEPFLGTAAIAVGLYVAHKGLESWESNLKQETEKQVQFLQHLDEAQLQITGVPAPPWLFI